MFGNKLFKSLGGFFVNTSVKFYHIKNLIVFVLDLTEKCFTRERSLILNIGKIIKSENSLIALW